MKARRSLLVLSLPALWLLAAIAYAQEAEPPAPAPEGEPVASTEEPQRARSSVIEEIVVTAQRKEENLQDVAISVSAISGEQMEEFNFQDAQRITDQIPNFFAGGLGGPGGPPFFSVRGISFVDFSNVNEASVGMYMDEVYLASQGSGTMQLFDLERVEVLRGPQGTLFGRNTTAGVTQFVSRKPTEELDGYGSLQYGENNQVVVEGAQGGPLSEAIRGRLAFKYNRDDGWQDLKLIGGHTADTDAWALRSIFDLDLTDELMLELNGHYAENDGHSPTPLSFFGLNPNDLTQWCGGQPVIGGPTDQSHADCLRSGSGANDLGVVLGGQDTDESYSNAEYPMEYQAAGTYVKLVGEFEWATLTSITAYEKYEQHFGYDIDTYDYSAANDPSGLQVDLNTNWRSEAEQVSHESRLNGDYNGFDWTLGFYYYAGEQGSLAGTQTNGAFGPTFNDAETETDSWAIFGQLHVPIAETLTAVGGLRYTDETRELTKLVCPIVACAPPGGAGTKNEIDTGAWTGKVALEWRPADEQLYYVQFSHGFKSGGFNPVANPVQRGPVDEETVDSWEVGAKRTFFDNTLRANAAFFFNQFEGLQALVGSVQGGLPVVFYINAGDPDIMGAELELAWAPHETFETMLSLAWLDTEISAGPTITADGRPLDGKELPQSPEFSVKGVIRYHIDLAAYGWLTLQADGRWQEDIFTGVDNDPAEFVESYGVLNVRTRWSSPDDRYSFEVFVDNVLDEDVIQHIFHNTVSGHPATANNSFVQDGFRTPGRPRLWGVRVGYQF